MSLQLPADRYRTLTLRHSHHSTPWFANTATPAPSSSNLVCVLGTNCGIVEMQDDQTMRWTVPHNQASYSTNTSSSSSSSLRRRNSSRRKNKHAPTDIFATTFQHAHPNVVFAAGRSPLVWTADLRGPETQWARFRHATAGVAHLRSVDEHRLLVSGLQNSMALYDTRYIRTSSSSSSGPAETPVATTARPLLIFPAHRNDAHLHIGFDVDTQLGVVAAAQHDGTVRLFSLRSGRRVDNPQVNALASNTPFKALQFSRLPHERFPSLFVGEGASIRKFSFGAEDVNEES